MWKIVDGTEQLAEELAEETSRIRKEEEVFRELMSKAISSVVPDLDLGLAKVVPVASKKHVCLIGGRGSGKSMLMRDLATSGYYETYLKAASKEPEERSVFEKAYMDYIDKGR